MAKTHGVDAFDAEDPGRPRRLSKRGYHLHVKDVGGGSGPIPEASQRGGARLSRFVGCRYDFLDGAADADVSLR